MRRDNLGDRDMDGKTIFGVTVKSQGVKLCIRLSWLSTGSCEYGNEHTHCTEAWNFLTTLTAISLYRVFAERRNHLTLLPSACTAETPAPSDEEKSLASRLICRAI